MDREDIVRQIAGILGPENIKTDVLMKNHTSFKVGGPADIMVVPQSRESLVEVYRLCKRLEVPVFVFGNGTNLIVRDKGIRGVVIKICDNLGNYTVEGDIIKADAGMLIGRLSKIALENSLTGLEFAEGIPGTLGGAVVMNAGAYTGEMADVVVSTDYMDKNGNVKTIRGPEHKFGKRSSFVQSDGGLVLGSELKLKKGDSAEIKAKMDDFNRQRREKQPLELPSAGSVFKRPEGYFAGKLVQDCGLKGYTVGGAQVSCKHCGFIVNIGNATADDIIRLIEHIQNEVYARYGVELHTEVKIVGEE